MQSRPKSHVTLLGTQAAEHGLINEQAAANLLGLSVSTLGVWRKVGRGPMAYQINETEFAYLDADIRTFESVCLDSFHDLYGNDRPKGVIWSQQVEAHQPTQQGGKRQSFKLWLKEQPDWQ